MVYVSAATSKSTHVKI